MNGLNNSGDEVVECPLCMEPLEVDDLNFYPCTCGYQICRFCWHRIRTDENELCPACRKEYPENPADFTPLTQEEILAFKSQKRQRDQQRKQKITENRKHLSNVRVVQKNLVFVVGLPPRLADAEILKKHEYFGKYGKIHKVVINPSTTYAGVQGPSASAYVTYVHNNDALRAIQSVNNVMIDGRLIKTSLGTTKYCSHFMKNQQCPKGDCMYLHELGDPEASFTKEEMHQGKHQEYEKRLHDALIAISGASSVGGIGHSNSSTSASTLGNGAMSSSISSSSSVSTVAPNGTATTAAMSAAGVQQKEAWPSLSVSPVNTKESISTSGKTKKEKSKPEKSKNDKSSRTKNKNSSSYNSTNNTANTTSKENSHGNVLKEVSMTLPGEATTVFVASEQNSVSANANNGNGGKLKNDKGKDKALSNRSRGLYHNDEQHSVSKEKRTISADEEVKLIKGLEKQVNDYKGDSNAVSNSTSTASVNKGHFEQSGVNKIEDQRSFSSSSNRSGSSNNSNSSTNNSDLLSLSESASGKSSPGSFPDCNSSSEKLAMKSDKAETDTLNSLSGNLSSQQLNVAISRESINNGNCELTATSSTLNNSNIQNETGVNIAKDNSNDHSEEIASKSADMNLPVSSDSDLQDTRVAFSKMNLFDDNNSFFSSGTSFQQSLLSKNKVGIESRQNQANSAISSHLPDLLKGIDEYPSNSVVNDFPNLGGHCHGSTDLNRFPQVALLQPQHQTQHQMGHPAEHLMSSNMFDTNMSKFFDFHKNQQQQLHQQHFLINGHTGGSGNNALSDHLRAVSLLENNRINYQFLDQSNGLLATQQQQQQIQKQRTLGKFDPMVNLPQNVLSDYILNSIVTQQLALQQQHQQSQSHPHSHQQPKQPGHLQGQYLQNACVDDDLGFDPFIETQKGLAELMENEVAQHQNANVNRNDTTTIATKILQHQQQQQQQNLLDNIQRTRMPPPGFNHMNAFGFGVPRTQSSSKILPFVNMSGNGPVNGGQTQQQHMQAPNSWNPHLAAFQTQQQTLNDSQTHSIALNQNNANHSKGYSNNDWTAMDPAILSFRQFSSFPPQTQMPHHLQSQDIYMPHLTQQQSSQNYATQSQLHGGTNLPSSILNSQPASQAQVNANVQGMLEYLKTRQFV